MLCPTFPCIGCQVLSALHSESIQLKPIKVASSPPLPPPPPPTPCPCSCIDTPVHEQVQAHVAQTEVDPGAAVAWLHVTDAGMEASPTANQLIRSMLYHCCLLCHKHTSQKNVATHSSKRAQVTIRGAVHKYTHVMQQHQCLQQEQCLQYCHCPQSSSVTRALSLSWKVCHHM